MLIEHLLNIIFHLHSNISTFLFVLRHFVCAHSFVSQLVFAGMQMVRQLKGLPRFERQSNVENYCILFAHWIPDFITASMESGVGCLPVNLFDLNTFQFQYHFMGSMISLKTDWTIGGGQLLSVRLLCNGNICADKFSSHLRKNNMVTSSNLYQGRSSHIYTMECLGKGTVFNHVIATFLFRIKLLTKLTSDLLSQSGCFASGSHSMESNLIAKNTIWEVYSAPPFCLTTSWKYKTRATEWRAKIVFQLG